MAARKLIEKSPTGEDSVEATAFDKIAMALAVIAVKDTDTDEAALRLHNIGFTAREISAILNVGLNYVNVARHRKQHDQKKRRKRAT
ncbi:MAG TPA: hypothetical protein VFW28_18270 [Micropepsaceae bacterium]|nr:hypothetical protein [Micropepsaceae bacterium]